jgi:hypothetical protein
MSSSLFFCNARHSHELSATPFSVGKNRRSEYSCNCEPWKGQYQWRPLHLHTGTGTGLWQNSLYLTDRARATKVAKNTCKNALFPNTFNFCSGDKEQLGRTTVRKPRTMPPSLSERKTPWVNLTSLRNQKSLYQRQNFHKGGKMQNNRPQRFLAVIFAILCPMVIWSCYPKPVGPYGPGGKELTWDEMNKDQRKTHMEKVVLPPAAELFRSWQPERFDTVSCNLCHNIETISDDFDMPTDHLPRLSGDWTLRPEFAKFPDTTQLKLDRLVPLMAHALGQKSFSIITRRGFGCYSCHLGPSGPLAGY